MTNISAMLLTQFWKPETISRFFLIQQKGCIC